MTRPWQPTDRWSQWCFDCDGTILDSSAVFTAVHRRAIAALGGTPVNDYWDLRRAGISEARLCAMAGVPEREVDRYLALRQEAFDRVSPVAPPFPSARPLLQQLRALGRQVVVISHRSSTTCLIRDLRRAGLSDCASRCYATKSPSDRRRGRNDASVRKSEVLRHLGAGASTVMIGDSVTDIRAARSAGVSSIGVAAGFCSACELRRCGAEWVFASLDELYAWAGAGPGLLVPTPPSRPYCTLIAA